VVEGESGTAVTVGESEGCVDMGHMMEDEEVEDREEDEESVGEEEGRERGGVRGMRRKWRGEGERIWRSEREGMTRTMKGKFHPPPTWTVVTGMGRLHHS
jgi:hypothetical protein